jgi:hypothetical protein
MNQQPSTPDQPPSLETARNLIDQIDRSELCQHLDVSRDRFEAALGHKTTEMPAVRMALKAMNKWNIQSYCGGL